MYNRLNIILVEDHAALRKVTADVLRQEGHLVIELTCAEDLEDRADAPTADLFIIDLNLPGEDGLSLARRLRAVHPRMGIIMLTGRDQPEDMTAGFRDGADQYLVKPVDPQTLLAAIEALTRRIKPELNRRKNLTADSLGLRLRGPRGETRLSTTEIMLLTALARAPGQRLALFQVSECLGQDEDHFNKASVEVRIARLRKKLIEVGAQADCLKALRNEGYQLCVPILIK
jgi:DNA-binding response OmpR family regulator